MVAIHQGREEERRRLVACVKRVDSAFAHARHGLVDAAETLDFRCVDWNLGRQILREDIEGTRAVRTIYSDTHVESPRAQHGRVDHVRAVGRADDHDVVEGFDAVHLCEQLRNDHRFDV